MKLRWIIALGVVALLLGLAALWLFSPNRAQRELERTRRQLRQQGFKVDLSEFDLSASGDLSARAAALTNAPFAPRVAIREDYSREQVLRQETPDLMEAVDSNAAIVVWKREKLALDRRANPWETAADNVWPALREALSEKRERLDTACAAALAGPFRFDLQASHGSAMLLPHAAGMKWLSQVLGKRAMLDLHDGYREAAWTNLLASARLVTAWQIEPVEVCHMVRFGCVSLAYAATWQTLQAPAWTDERLAALQHEWESADLWKALPETAAFSRASAAGTCQQERSEPLEPSLRIRDMRSPKDAWYSFIYRWRRIGYRHQGSYEDERALLLHYRDREAELRRAVQAPTWAEMRQLPGVTNFVPFVSRQPSRVRSMLNLRQMSLGMLRGGQSFLGRAAEAEARRRLLVTAIALHRYRGRHGAYPQALEQLGLELLLQPPKDFMDGQPLRYRPTADGHFVLYSVGLDCVDNGGEMRRPQPRGQGFPGGFGGMDAYGGPAGRGWGGQEGTDLVWPRPASPAEVLAHEKELDRQAQAAKTAAEERWAEQERHAEGEGTATVESAPRSR